MSRVGNAPISLPKGVTIDATKGNMVTVKGPKRRTQEQFDQDMQIGIEDGVLSVKRPRAAASQSCTRSVKGTAQQHGGWCF